MFATTDTTREKMHVRLKNPPKRHNRFCLSISAPPPGDIMFLLLLSENQQIGILSMLLWCIFVKNGVKKSLALEPRAFATTDTTHERKKKVRLKNHPRIVTNSPWLQCCMFNREWNTFDTGCRENTLQQRWGKNTYRQLEALKLTHNANCISDTTHGKNVRVKNPPKRHIEESSRTWIEQPVVIAKTEEAIVRIDPVVIAFASGKFLNDQQHGSRRSHS